MRMIEGREGSTAIPRNVTQDKTRQDKIYTVLHRKIRSTHIHTHTEIDREREREKERVTSSLVMPRFHPSQKK
jgi:hypothetical protein